MTDEELENEALDLAGEAWEMVKRGRMINPPETFEEMIEIAKKWILEKEAPQVERSVDSPKGA